MTKHTFFWINSFTSDKPLRSNGGMETAKSGYMHSSPLVADQSNREMPGIITQVTSIDEARALPCGTVVGDPCGGLTFKEHVAAVLESRSWQGWYDVNHGQGATPWTIIRIDW